MEPTTAIVVAGAAYLGRPLTAALARLALSACGAWGPRFLEHLSEARIQGALEARRLDRIKAGAWDEALEHERARRIENRTRILTAAAHEASQGAEIPPEQAVQGTPIDPDWWDAFWEGAEKVSNEQMQGVWARKLGQVALPTRLPLG